MNAADMIEARNRWIAERNDRMLVAREFHGFGNLRATFDRMVASARDANHEAIYWQRRANVLVAKRAEARS